METIFDHVTKKKIKACGFLDDFQRIRHGIYLSANLAQEKYVKNIKENDTTFDVALFVEHRGKNRDKYWKKYRAELPSIREVKWSRKLDSQK